MLLNVLGQIIKDFIIILLGKDITNLEAKADILFEKLKEKGVLNIAIGDLGNELGMGTLKDHLEKYIPRAAKGSCDCPCKGGLI